MKLMTKAIERKLPALYSQDGKDPRDVKVPLKIFDPCSNWTWYATEYDPETRTFFGLVVGHYTELGSFSLTELEGVKGRMGIGLERDQWWDSNTTLDKVYKEHDFSL